MYTNNLALTFLKIRLPTIYWSTNHMYNHFIIIMSCHQHGYPWPILDTFPDRSSPLAGLQGYIPYPHIAAVCMFELLSHMWGSIGVHHLWARPCFSSSVLRARFIWLSFRDGRQVAVQLVLCWVLPPGLVQYCSQHSCVIAV